MEWLNLTMRVCIISLIVSFHSAPASAQRLRHRPLPPPTQGFFVSSFGTSLVELHGLRVPIVISTEAHQRILLLASYWAEMLGASLRVVSAMDHIHARQSAHYSGMAIDFQGEHLDSLATWFREWGYTVYWKQPGHWKHVHVEDNGGHPKPPRRHRRRSVVTYK